MISSKSLRKPFLNGSKKRNHEKRYSWHGESFEKSVRKRDQLETAINESRKRNSGGVDLRTLDQICLWGFGQRFPLRDQQAAINSTREAFENADEEDYYKAVRTLMNISGVGISRASKIIGLSDQNRLCIYDSRVGHALRDLKKGNAKLIKCPPDRSYKRDCDCATKSDWASDYERLIWTIEIMREYFKARKQPLRAADIEMALFIIGE
jgi:hypothetical protein